MDTGGGSSNKADDKSSETGGHHHHNHLFRQVLRIMMLFTVVGVSCLVLYHSAYPFQFLPSSFYKPSSTSTSHDSAPGNLSSPGKEDKLESVLKKAAMANKTVIITTLNEAWAAPNSILDLFLESFRIGNQTSRLLNHLIIVALDQKAYARCLALHPHCYSLSTEGIDFSGEAYFMTGDYLKMMWTRIDFLHSVLKLGYDFVFTDADIMWFRDPFPRLYPDADFQIACDNFRGNSYDLNNRPNGGFNYVKSNNRTVHFYNFWYTSRKTYPNLHDQDVLNKIKYDPFIRKIGLQIRFLDTAYFGGFCEPSKDFNLVCTMHANCCYGLDNKVHDLSVMLEDWRKFMSLPADKRASQRSSWSVPQNCSLSNFHPPDSHKKKAHQGSNN
uniref:Nucleotide-diphospho-sugar transferase domain-containing protein n=1 Tax=Davidia involucrata TaxID=16924 RepID=A0A5B7BT12_DAVIN